MSYSHNMVRGATFVGGLVGLNAGDVGLNVEASITASYSIGEVSGNEKVGGLVGYNQSGTVSTCFWDIETSGQNISAGGTGKTTIQMQINRTFLEAGWDFMNETANGTEDIWWIIERHDYPRLWWELTTEN